MWRDGICCAGASGGGFRARVAVEQASLPSGMQGFRIPREKTYHSLYRQSETIFLNLSSPLSRVWLTRPAQTNRELEARSYSTIEKSFDDLLKWQR